MRIENEFDIGDQVYLVTDEEQLMRLITGIIVRPGQILYEVTYSDEEPTIHYGFEISKEKSYK